MAKYTKQEVAESLARLREWIKPGDTVYTIVRSVSRSGMSRNISLVLFRRDEDGREYTMHPNYHAARVLGETLVNDQGSDALRVHGAGMDMAWHTVYCLSHALFGKDDALTQRSL